jgi:hypothetical protein
MPTAHLYVLLLLHAASPKSAIYVLLTYGPARPFPAQKSDSIVGLKIGGRPLSTQEKTLFWTIAEPSFSLEGERLKEKILFLQEIANKIPLFCGPCHPDRPDRKNTPKNEL